PPLGLLPLRLAPLPLAPLLRLLPRQTSRHPRGIPVPLPLHLGPAHTERIPRRPIPRDFERRLPLPVLNRRVRPRLAQQPRDKDPRVVRGSEVQWNRSVVVLVRGLEPEVRAQPVG